MPSRIAGGLLRSWPLEPAAELRSLDILSGGRINAQAIFPSVCRVKLPHAPVFNEDQFSRVRVRPETRTERPKAGQEGFSSLTFTRSHWRVGGALFWR